MKAIADILLVIGCAGLGGVIGSALYLFVFLPLLEQSSKTTSAGPKAKPQALNNSAGLN